MPIDADGGLGEASSFVQHAGSSIDPQRPEGPHAHSINLDADNRYALVADLGLDKVLVYRFDPTRGTLTANDPPHAIVTLKDSPQPGYSTAEIQVHPSGRFLYASNRGHDTIAVFTIDQESGKLTPAEHEPTRGRSPRSFAIDPTCRFLLVANQLTNSIVVFRIDQESGTLTPTGETVSVPSPVCLRFDVAVAR